MARRNPPAKWVLPETIDPEERLCFTIQVPNEVYHIAAFRGALWNLCSAVNWQDDPDHKAKDVANVWREIYDEVDACLMAVTDVRQNDETPCILEKKIDDGDWEEFANLQLCPPRIRRLNGVLQFFDGGTWIPLPEGDGDDPMDGVLEPQWTTPPTGQTGNCLAAENITALLQSQVLEWSAALTAGAIALGIATIITGVLSAFFIPPATPAILSFGTVLIGIGASGLESAFTTEVYDRFKCIVNCHAESDGSITVDDYDAIIADIEAETGTAWELIPTWMSFLGAVGVTRAAASAGITSGDCDDCLCGWCHTFDFTVDDQDFIANTSPQLRAVYVAGVGWKHSSERNDRITAYIYPGVTFNFTFATVVITSCDGVSNIGHGWFSPAFTACVDGVSTSNVPESGVPGWGFDVVTNDAVDPAVTSVTIYGNGENPFGTDNC